MDYKEALSYARKKHLGQYRKHGEDYINHPERVVEILKAKGISKDEVLMAGLFHDLLEDTDAREEEILNLGNKRVLELVKLLSKEVNYKMEDYIGGIKSDRDAIDIKLADRIANLEDSFNLSKEYKGFLESYIKDTKDYYIDLARATVFQDDLRLVLDKLEEYVEKL